MSQTQQAFRDVLPYVGELAFAVLTALVAFLSQGLSRLIKTKTTNSKQAALFEALADATTTAVLEVAQTMRGPMLQLARDGKLRTEDAETLKRAAVARAKDLLTEAGWIALVTFSGGEVAAKKVLEAKIERAVLESKALTERDRPL